MLPGGNFGTEPAHRFLGFPILLHPFHARYQFAVHVFLDAPKNVMPGIDCPGGAGISVSRGVRE
jgi:hypothetical protein